MELEKTTIVNELIDLYGILLTPNQLNIIELYYKEDLSLSEVGEELGISRNAVFDSLKKSLKLLENYEEKLQLNQKDKIKKDIIDRMKKLSKKEILILINKI